MSFFCRRAFVLSRFRHALVPLTLLAGTVPQGAQAQIYVGEVDGAVLLSNFSTAAASQTLVDAPEEIAPVRPAHPGPPGAASSEATAGASNPNPRGAPPLPPALKPMFERIGREHALPSALLAAVAAAESGFDGRAQSNKGAQGLMQLMPGTARQHGVRQIWSLEDNLRGGAAHLRGLLRRFSGDITLALAAYNAGEQAVLRAGMRVPDFEETQRYVPKVLAWQRDYARRN